MVWACGKNGRVKYGQKGIDGRSHWRTGARETEVRLVGWCEGGLRQQRNYGRGSPTMRERSERVNSPGRYGGSIVWDWRVSRAGPMLLYWPKLLYPYYRLLLFFPFSFCL